MYLELDHTKREMVVKINPNNKAEVHTALDDINDCYEDFNYLL